MYYINMILGKGKTYALLGGHAGGIIQIFDLESGLAQAVGEVVTVETTVVVLAEDAVCFAASMNLNQGAAAIIGKTN